MTNPSALKWRARKLLSSVGLWSPLEKGRLFVRLVSRQAHEREFAFFSHFEGEPGLFLDVGANIGQSAVSFRIYNRSFDILSLEPNPLLESDLRFVKRLLGSRFDYRMVGTGAADATLPIFVPLVDGVPLYQESSFVREQVHRDPVFLARVRQATGQAESSVELRELSLSIVKLDGLGLKPRVVKIDVQGSELATLQGMQETLAQARPVLLIENGASMSILASWLADAGYSEPRAFDGARLTRIDAAHPQLNLFFVPDEKVAEWAAKDWISS